MHAIIKQIFIHNCFQLLAIFQNIHFSSSFLFNKYKSKSYYLIYTDQLFYLSLKSKLIIFNFRMAYFKIFYLFLQFSNFLFVFLELKIHLCKKIFNQLEIGLFELFNRLPTINLSFLCGIFLFTLRI